MTAVCLDLARLRGSVGAASQLLKALANPDRLLLLCRLAEAECNVGELQAASGIVQPSLSQQLAVLRREGLVATRRAGKQIHYRIADPAVLAVIHTLHQLFCAEERP
ncbi:MAG TPA: metalloregulator ArsR/SmtB family transcription factor [Pseudomonas sp.]|nr:metalloregulator ArsR/SmtB family transcription factor [Pseudomonas sp.]